MGHNAREGLIDGAADSLRDFRRYAVELNVQVRMAAGAGVAPAIHALRNPFRPGVIKDLSVQGLYFIASARFEIGTVLDMELLCDNSVYSLQAVVRRVELDRISVKPTYGTGTQFLRSERSTAAVQAIARYLLRRSTHI